MTTCATWMVSRLHRGLSHSHHHLTNCGCLWQRYIQCVLLSVMNTSLHNIMHGSSLIQIVDELHFRNHVDQTCRATYNPAQVKAEKPDLNFMVAEQTFSWLTKFRRILCAMPKTHHLFYLHRLVKRRNKYTELCHGIKRSPLLPKSS